MTLLNKSIVSPILVGRAEEVARLESAVATVSQGRGQVLLVTGEAGIGKSRLVAEVRQQALASGFTVLSGYCFEDDLLFPYAPLIDALRAFLAPQAASAVAARLGVLAAELVKLLPELTLTLPMLQPTPALDSEAEKRRLFEALLQFLTQLTQGQPSAPLLLILEDLHWCDETSLDFLRLLARRITALPILVLGSYRRDESTPALQPPLSQLERGRLAHEVHLRPLPEAEVQTLLQAIFELKRPVRTDFLTVLYRLTEGNPFFIEEVLKGLIASGDIFYADGQWDRKPKPIEELHIPSTVQAAVQRRMGQVSAPAHHLLTVAAVVGQRFDYPLLQQVTGKADQELVALLRELVAAQLVVEASTDHFVFRHALTRQAVYSELLGHERQLLHRTIGAAIEQIYTDRLDTQAADLAYHFTAASEWDKALVYAQRAGEQAQALSTPHAAIEQFSRALQAAQQLRQKESLPVLYRARGLAYDIVGDFTQARADLEMVLKLAQAAADRQMEWQALLDLGQMWTGRDYGQTGNYYQRALALARTLETPTTLANSLNRIGNWHLNRDEMPQAIRYHQEALTIFERLADQRGLAQTFDLLGMTHTNNGELMQGSVNFQQAVALWSALNERQGLASSLSVLGQLGVSYYTDMYISTFLSAAICNSRHEQALQIVHEIGWRAGEAYALIASGATLGSQGQYGKGLAMFQRALALAQAIEHNEWLCLALRDLGVIELDLLALPLAQQHLEQGLALANEMGSSLHVNMATGYLILLYIGQEEWSKAEQLLRNQWRPDLPITLPGQLLWRGRIELALAQGDAHLALQSSDRFFMTAANAANHEISAIPYLAYLQGRALTTLQRWPEAEATFQATLATALVQETPRFLWRLQLALGQLYQAQGRPGAAAQAFAAARTVIDQITATITDTALRDNFVQQTQALLPPPPVVTPHQPAKASDVGLTRREREVAALVAAGKSNRAIAEALVIGERTVEGHVGNLLGKLGFTSRAQIAAWAVESRLTKP